MKLFLWENVLYDWTGGVMFALAESREQAEQLILATAEGEYRQRDIAEDLQRVDPRVIDTPFGFHLHGGR